TWWTTAVGTVQDKEVSTFDFLVKKEQPVQFWSTPNNFRGFIDIFTRCFRRKKNEDGLYDFSVLGRRGLLGFLGRQNDGVGVVRALNQPGQSLVPPAPVVVQAGSVNTGLSNVVTRTAGLDPHWVVKPDPNNSRGLKQIQPPPNPVPPGRLDPHNDLWIDRARLFQGAISQLTAEFGTVDLAINDFDPAN